MSFAVGECRSVEQFYQSQLSPTSVDA